MPKVTTKKAHSNGYGKNYAKKIGDKYDHPSPGALVKQGIVATETAAKTPAPSETSTKSK